MHQYVFCTFYTHASDHTGPWLSSIAQLEQRQQQRRRPMQRQALPLLLIAVLCAPSLLPHPPYAQAETPVKHALDFCCVVCVGCRLTHDTPIGVLQPYSTTPPLTLQTRTTQPLCLDLLPLQVARGG